MMECPKRVWRVSFFTGLRIVHDRSVIVGFSSSDCCVEKFIAILSITRNMTFFVQRTGTSADTDGRRVSTNVCSPLSTCLHVGTNPEFFRLCSPELRAFAAVHHMCVTFATPHHASEPHARRKASPKHRASSSVRRSGVTRACGARCGTFHDARAFFPNVHSPILHVIIDTKLRSLEL